MDIESMYRKWPQMAHDALKLTVTHELDSDTLARVVIAGMGGSGIVGDYTYWLARVHGSSLPFETVKDLGPFPPGWLNASLVFLVSYSGNTRETLAFANYALNEAQGDPLSTPTMLVAVTSGGELEQLAKKRQIPLIKIPSGLLPRASLPYLLIPVLRLLVETGALGTMGIEELKAGIQAIENLHASYVARAGEVAEKLAEWRGKEIMPAAVGCGASVPLVTRLKAEMAENAKTLLIDIIVPEAGHNQIEALIGEKKPIGLIMLDPDYEPCSQTLKAFEKVLSEASLIKDVLKWNRGNLGFFSWYLLTSMAWGLMSTKLAIKQGRNPAETQWLKKYRKYSVKYILK